VEADETVARADHVDGARAGPYAPVAPLQSPCLVDDVGRRVVMGLDDGEDLGADVALPRAFVHGIAPVPAH
jgi:hypothetical protein